MYFLVIFKTTQKIIIITRIICSLINHLDNLNKEKLKYDVKISIFTINVSWFLDGF